MKKLTIKKLGPIKNVEMDIRRVNVIIGPQSSGKSTVAKVISTCEWVEKEVATMMDEHIVPDANAFRDLLVKYHRMIGYFNSDTLIRYESDHVSIVYENEELHISLKSKDTYQREKICYVPAERNMITSPELQGFEFGQTSLKSFLFDWYNAREIYTGDNKKQILNLDVKYFYDPSEARFKDRIEHTNGVTYNIPRYAASSGLQSVVPLQITLDYYSGLYFKTFENITSFDYNAKKEAIRKQCVVEYVLKKYYDNYTKGYDLETVKEINHLYQEHDEKLQTLYQGYIAAFERLTKPKRTNFILEEPEQNLYPSTQKQFVYALAAILNGGEHSCVISTHSPYIMTSLNNLILAADKMAESQDKAQKVQERIPAQASLPFDDVAAFEMIDGQLRSIKDEEFRMIAADALDKASEEIGDDYNFLLSL